MTLSIKKHIQMMRNQDKEIIKLHQKIARNNKHYIGLFMFFAKACRNTKPFK